MMHYFFLLKLCFTSGGNSNNDLQTDSSSKNYSNIIEAGIELFNILKTFKTSFDYQKDEIYEFLELQSQNIIKASPFFYLKIEDEIWDEFYSIFQKLLKIYNKNIKLKYFQEYNFEEMELQKDLNENLFKEIIYEEIGIQIFHCDTALFFVLFQYFDRENLIVQIHYLILEDRYFCLKIA
ncbi:hypothetical protein GVAV_001216 [Gurleya vavrai]